MAAATERATSEPKVGGIVETALYVQDLHCAAVFYQRVFGFETLAQLDRLVALEVAERDVLLLFLAGATLEDNRVAGGVIPGHGARGRGHLAFAIGRDELQPWRDRLQELGVTVESEVAWPGGAASIYFRDPDENLVELLTPGFWRVY
jgi:catechol 2,3-dioxygenase-like lactoylglutathione lyase family enzyme